MNIVVMWSGGVESTYTVAKLLEEGHTILAHHVILKDNQNRFELEKNACRLMKEILKERFGERFYYVESVLDLRSFGWNLRDMYFFGLLAANTMRSAFNDFKKEFNTWTVGVHYHENYVFSGGNISEKLKISIKVCELVSHGFNNPSFFTVDQLIGKKEELDYLESIGLKQFVWSCRRPDMGKPCGVCHACKEIEESYK